MLYRHLALILAAALTLACTPRKNTQELSQPHFIPFDSASQCAFTSGYLPALNVCVQSGGASQQATDRQQRYLAIGIEKWMQALQQVDSRITTKVNFTCNNPVFTAIVRAGSGTASSGCGHANLYSYESADESGEDPVLQGTTLHELGHGLAGLSDTYSGRQAGACQAGQPESIMCWGGYGPKKDSDGNKTLYDDDIKGIQEQFKRFQSEMVTPPGGLPPAGSVPPAGGGGIGVPPISGDLFAAIASKAGDLRRQVLFVSTSSSNIRISICDQNVIGNCRDPFVDGAAGLRQVNAIAGRNIYRLEGFAPDPSKIYSILVWQGQGQPVATRPIRFREK